MEIFLRRENHKNTAMVKTIICSLIFAMLFISPTPLLAENNNTTMVFIIDNNTYTTDGELIVMDVAPVIIEGRTMLPIRYAATPLGADIKWDGEEKKVTLLLGEKKLELWVGQSGALINGSPILIDSDNPNVKPLIINGRTMLPLRFVTENLGCSLLWDAVNKKVTIIKDSEVDVSVIKPTIPDIGSVLEPTTPGIGSVLKPTIPDLGSVIGKYLTKNQIDKLVISADTSKIQDFWKNKAGIPIKVTLNEADFPVVLRIGRGYNVFGEYASALSLKQAVLDLNKLIVDQKIERINYDRGAYSEITGESIRTYSNQMSIKSGLEGRYFCFGGSANINFSSGRTEQSNNYFSTMSKIIRKYGVYVNGATNLKNYLNIDAKKMINDNNTPASTVFANYGHYVLVDTITGGRVDYSITASSKASTSYENFKAATKADFNVAVLKAGASTEYQNIINKSAYDSNKEIKLQTLGGSFSLDPVQLNNDPQILSKWENTLEEKGTLVDFGDTTAKALIPIWELADNPARANYLKAEFEKLNLAQANRWPAEQYVTDIVFVTDINEWTAREKCPDGYFLVNRNLNQGLISMPFLGKNANYIYLCYKLGDNINEAYTDFFMELTAKQKSTETKPMSHNSNFVDYTRINTDLNKGAGGDFIYMWTTKAKTMNAIKGIDVAFDNPNNVQPGWDSVFWINTTSPADVNKGVGGSFIYIKYTR